MSHSQRESQREPERVSERAWERARESRKSLGHIAGGEPSGNTGYLCPWLRTSTPCNLWLLHLLKASTNHGLNCQCLGPYVRNNLFYPRWTDLAAQCPGYLTSLPYALVLNWPLDLSHLSLRLYCHVSRWWKAREGVQALPGQPAQPEQHLRPALRLHQHVLWTSCQGDLMIDCHSMFGLLLSFYSKGATDPGDDTGQMVLYFRRNVKVI